MIYYSQELANSGLITSEGSVSIKGLELSAGQKRHKKLREETYKSLFPISLPDMALRLANIITNN